MARGWCQPVPNRETSRIDENNIILFNQLNGFEELKFDRSTNPKLFTQTHNTALVLEEDLKEAHEKNKGMMEKWIEIAVAHEHEEQIHRRMNTDGRNAGRNRN